MCYEYVPKIWELDGSAWFLKDLAGKYFFKFQMPMTSSKIWLETRFVYDEYDWYCRQIWGTGNTDARFDEAMLRSSSAQ
jgi:hypothetical protein